MARFYHKKIEDLENKAKAFLAKLEEAKRKGEAEKLKKELEEAGATVELK